MLEITELAIGRLKEFQAGDTKGLPVRIAIMSGASKSPNLGVVTDAVNDNDVSYDFDELTVIIDKGLLDYCVTIHVDYVKMDSESCSVEGGFRIKVENTL